MSLSFDSQKFIIFSLLLLLPVVLAQETENPCNISQSNSRPGGAFDFNAWMSRGRCIHHLDDYDSCRSTLLATLDSLNSLHASEYSASATILTLLPTISAVFGTPTTEIWILLSVLPFGGALATLLSYGGSIVPAKSTEYEDERISPKAGKKNKGGEENGDATVFLDRLSQKVSEKLEAGQHKELPLGRIFASLFVMMLLLVGALAGMGIIEYGAVYMTWCTSLWWFHLWYITLTTVAVADNWVSLPFNRYAKLYLSVLPHDYEVRSDSSHIQNASNEDGALMIETITATSEQNGTTAAPATIKPTRSYEAPAARDTLVVQVSIARDGPDGQGPSTSPLRYATKLFLKLGAVTIYVFSTSVFAAVTLLALPMAQMILMLVIGSGIIGRALVASMVWKIKQKTAFIHIITHSKQEAARVVTRIFEDQAKTRGDGGSTARKFQIENEHGHVFVDRVHVSSRSPWPRRFLGILAKPYCPMAENAKQAQQGYSPLSRRKTAYEEEETSSV